jgi:hypothetical protein
MKPFFQTIRIITSYHRFISPLILETAILVVVPFSTIITTVKLLIGFQTETRKIKPVIART